MKKFFPHVLGAIFVLIIIGAWMLITYLVKKPNDTDISGTWQVRAFDDTMLTEDSVSFPTISLLENGMITATAGCNRMGGDYQYSNGQLIIKDGMYQTMMLCDNEQMMRNEQLLAQTLHDTLAVTALSADSVLVQGTHTMIIVR